MIVCTACDEEFEDWDEGEAHVIEAHANICDEKLEEYVSDAQQDACDELLEEK